MPEKKPAKPRVYTHSKATGRPAAARAALVQSFKRLFDGNGNRDDADIVLADLANIAGYYRRPNYGDWMARTKTPQGFELHSALSNARAEVVQHIMDMLQMTPDDVIALERAARAEAR